MIDINKDKRYTFADLSTWGEGNLWEIIDGYPYDNNFSHTITWHEVRRTFFNYLFEPAKDRGYALYIFALDTKLSEYDVVEPDVMLITDPSIIKDFGIDGVPTMIVEINSDETRKRNKIPKRDLYERYGVKEYMIVEPEQDKFIEVYRRQEHGGYGKSEFYFEGDELDFITMPDIKIPVSEIFETPFEKDKE